MLDRDQFLKNLQEWGEKNGKPMNLIGKAAFEQRLKDESDNTLFPQSQKATGLQPPPSLTPEV